MTSVLRARAGTRALAVLCTPVAAAVALLVAGASAQAQEATTTAQANPGVVDTVVITGIRRGIESAISVKKNADSIVEAISAEDLGKLPDTSIAESVSRLPGVAAQRTLGRAQQISIRGMAPDFATSLLNGREQASTGDSRSAEFDQYASELLSGVVIYKTPDGRLVGQGLSGTTDLQTVRPLDRPAREVALSYRKNRLNVGGGGEEGDGNRFSIAYVDQFLDRTVGVALGFARLDEKGGLTSKFESWGTGTAQLNGTGPALNVPFNGFNSWLEKETRKRDGIAATLQYRPSKDFSSTLDYFKSKFEKTKSSKAFQAGMNETWLNPPFNYDRPGVLTSATVDANNNVTAGTFNNVRGVVRNDIDNYTDKVDSLGWNNRLKVGDGWTLEADLAQSKARRTGAIMETTAGVPITTLGSPPYDTMQFTASGNFTPGLDYTNRNLIKLTDVEGWGGGIATPQAGYSKLPHIKDTLNGIRLGAKRDVAWGPVVNVEGGVHFSDRNKERAYVEGRLVVLGGNPLGAADIPGTGVTSLPLPGGGSISVATFDPSSAIGSIYEIASKEHPDIFNKDWKVKEKVTTLYSKADLETELGGLQLRGNVGLQFVMTDQKSTAFNVDRTTCANDECPNVFVDSGGDKYTDVLPSLNLATDLGDIGTMRFALARVMARPKVDDLRQSFSFGYDSGKGKLTGSGGNPDLKPFRANAVDLSWEKYFGTKAYVSAAVFYKHLSTYIVNITDPNFDFASYVTPSSAIPTGLSLVGENTKPLNGSGGRISGIELSGSFPLNMAWGGLDGFGLFASYANTTSSVNLPAAALSTDSVSTPTIPLPGLSKRVTNYGVYFEKWGFSARVAGRSRSDFLGEVTTTEGDRKLTYIKGETIVDAQIGYEFQTGYLKGLAIRAEASNLTNEPFIRYRQQPAGDPGNQAEDRKDGKFYQIGLNYKF